MPCHLPVPVPSAVHGPRCRQPLERGIYTGLHNGVPIYFAITSAGDCLYGVHLTEHLEAPLVGTRLKAVLDREDPVEVTGLPLMAADRSYPPVESVVVLPLVPPSTPRPVSSPRDVGRRRGR